MSDAFLSIDDLSDVAELVDEPADLAASLASPDSSACALVATPTASLLPAVPREVTAALDVVRRGFAPAADELARTLARSACHRLLQLLGGPPQVPGALATPMAMAAPAISAIADLIRTTPTEQLFDMAIARLRKAVPAGESVPVAPSVRFHLVPLPDAAAMPSEAAR